jgi:hypothetical protein
MAAVSAIRCNPDVLETTERRRQTLASCSCGLGEKAAYHSQCRAAIKFGVASFRGSNNIVASQIPAIGRRLSNCPHTRTTTVG